jgi:hypothetical protein
VLTKYVASFLVLSVLGLAAGAPPDCAGDRAMPTAHPFGQKYAVYYKESKESDPWTYDSEQDGLTAAQDRVTYLETKLRKYRAAYVKRG